MIVRSNSFENNAMIPKKHTGFGEDLSPELILSDIPKEAVSLAIILDDLDVPWKRDYNHWIAWNIPNTEIIPEGLPKGAKMERPINACQGIGWGKNCYRGPKPPFFLKKAHKSLNSSMDKLFFNSKFIIYCLPSCNNLHLL